SCRGVHRNGGIVGGSFAAFDRFVDTAICSKNPRSFELNALRVGLILKGVLSSRGCCCVCEGLEYDLTKLTGQSVFVNRRDGEILQGPARVSSGWGVPLLEKLL